MPTDNQIEQEIQAKGLTAPRITPADIEANITSEFYFTAADGVDGSFGAYPGFGVSFNERESFRMITFCVLTLRNGTRIVGVNYGSVCPENFSENDGRKYARENAIDQIWPLMGYELRSRIAAG